MKQFRSYQMSDKIFHVDEFNFLIHVEFISFHQVKLG